MITQQRKPKSAQLAAENKKTPRFSRSVSGPYAQMRCQACGALGCLIPVPHTEPRTGCSVE